jgi:hypothetical protein
LKKDARAAALCILLIATLLTVTSFQTQTTRANPGTDDPQHIHLTYQHSPTSTITVTWQTTYSSTGDNVLYDTVARGGDASGYGLTASGSNHTYPGATGYIHDVELTNLIFDCVSGFRKSTMVWWSVTSAHASEYFSSFS